MAVRTAQEGGPRITVNQKIMVHLVEYVRYQDRPEAPRDITQQGISEVVNARRSHVSLALSTLRERGLVEEKMVRVTDEVRRRKGYFLTAKGYDTAKDLVKKFLARTVRVEGSGGVRDVKVSDLAEVLGDRYYLVDILCCTNREGILDVAQLTGQKAEVPPEPTPEPKAPSARATTFCPNCNNRLEFPYDTETMFNVVCGSCGNSFRASVGTPVYGQVAPHPGMAGFMEPESPAERSPRARAGTTSASLLIIGAGLSLVGALLINIPFGVLAMCGLTLPGLILLVVGASGVKDPVWGALSWASVILLLLAAGFIFKAELAVIGLGLQWAGPLVAVTAAFGVLRRSERTRLSIGVLFAIASMPVPLIGWWGMVISFGLVFGAGATLAAAAATGTKREGREKDMFVASALLTAMAVLTYAHWVFVPRWDTMAVARLALLTVPVFAFCLLARPISAKHRAESAVALGAVLAAISVPSMMAPWFLGFKAEYAGYFVVLGAGCVYLGTRLHAIGSMWPLVSLGLGFSVAVFSLTALALHFSALSILWKIALLAWTLAGVAMCLPRLVKKSAEMLLSVRTGAIAATGMAVLLAGVYMIIAGLRIEGAVEVFLGAPLLGYAVVRGGAPWRPKLAMCALMMASVGLTWASIVTNLL